MQRIAPLFTLFLFACGPDVTPSAPFPPWPTTATADAGPATARTADAGPSFLRADAGREDGGPRPAGCGEVTTGGRCDAIDLITFCDTETVGVPIVRYRFCAKGERCQSTSTGAECEPTGACREGATRCRTSQELETCQDGRWVTQRCPRSCNAGNALGAFCEQAVETRVVEGTANYEARVPNASYTGWGEKRTIQASFFTVLSVVARGEEVAVFDAAVADAAGRFSLKVPSASASALVLVAAGFGPGGELQFMVADPGFGRSSREAIFTVGSKPRVWMWALPTPPAGTPVNLVAREENGSGAAHMALYLHSAFRRAAILHPGRAAPSVVAWVEPGTSWDCGSCFSTTSTTVFSNRFATQVWIGGGANGREYWSDAVVAHELGHWHMAGFGTSPNEGGKHVIGVPTFPGQAWSEGWATFYSSDVRDDPRYFSQQSGSFFWFDLGTRATHRAPFAKPRPSAGLLQKLDENLVASWLWDLSRAGTTARRALYAALASPRMNQAPFLRGYTRHTWDVATDGSHYNVRDTGESRPAVPDFFDALLCAGFSAPALDATLHPTTEYPYSTSRPLCR